MSFKNLPLAVTLAVTCFPAFAETGQTESLELEHVLVVTASRRTEPMGDSLASISVLTRERIEQSAARDLADLLHLLPGVDVTRTGGPGAQTGVFLRGGNSNHVLVLIDGVRAASSNTGAYAWEQLPLNQVERVELVRGPRGSLYGSDSIGGVIHVITRSAPEPYVRATGGSYDSWAFEGGLGHRGENSQISLNAGYRAVGGFSSQNPNGFSYDPDDDGFKTANIGLKGSWRPEHGTLSYSLLALDNESEFDQGTSETRQAVASVGFNGSISPNWDYQLLAGYATEELSTDFGFFSNGFESDRFQLAWQNQVNVGARGAVGFGLDHYDENGKSLDSWDENRHNSGLFATYDFHGERSRLQLAGRFDDNSEFGSEFTGQAALGFELGQGWRITGSYGSAFRGPNLNEQFSPGWWGMYAGNPSLEPESSTSGEFGLSWHNPALGTFTASLYRTDVEDLISFSGEMFQAVNIDEARLEGLELAYQLVRGAWSFNAGATFQDTKDLASGESLLRRPDENGAVTLDYNFESGSWLGFEWVYTGSRLDVGGIELDSYQLLNLRGAWKFAADWRLEARGENLADEEYEPAYGFNAAGRSLFISLAWIP